jgi:hypothetical protein
VQNQCIQSSSPELLFQPSEVNPILNNVVCLRLPGYYPDWVATSVGQLSLLQRNNQQVKVVWVYGTLTSGSQKIKRTMFALKPQF